MSGNFIPPQQPPLPSQYDGSVKLQELFEVLNAPFVNLSMQTAELKKVQSLQYAQGSWLDLLGEDFLLPREPSESDEDYRLRLQLQAGFYNRQGQLGLIYDIVSKYTQGFVIKEKPDVPAFFVIEIFEQLTQETTDKLTAEVEFCRPAGVGFKLTYAGRLQLEKTPYILTEYGDYIKVVVSDYTPPPSGIVVAPIFIAPLPNSVVRRTISIQLTPFEVI